MGKLPSVKRWYAIVLGGILIMGIVYIYLHRQDFGLTGTPGQQSSEPAPKPPRITWAAVDRSPDGFKIDMPTDTRQIEVPAYNQQGGADQVDMIFSTPDQSTSFSVSWAENPPVARAEGENAGRTLDAARDGALASTQTTLVTESQSNIQGYPARDFVGRNDGGGIFNARLIVAGQKLYLLMASFPAVCARRDSDVNRFFNSFSIVGPAR